MPRPLLPPTPTPRPRRTRPTTLFALAASLAWASCRGADSFQREADEEVFQLLDARLAALTRGEVDFDITPPEDSLRGRIMRGEVEDVGELTLVQCLEIAAEDNERYRSERESLFLEALALTLDRWRFAWVPTVDGGGALAGTSDEATSAAADGNVRFNRLFGSGARLITDVGANLFRLLSTGDGFDVVSNLGVTVTQPLLRGFGSKIVREPLTQAERDLVYRARTYERFRRTFSVDVATQVYGILEAYTNLENEERNRDNLVVLQQRNEALAEAGQLSDIQADQAGQDVLRSENRLVAQRGALGQRLDSFKLFLGLPMGCTIAVDREEFARLSDEGALLDVFDALPEERVIQFAWDERLDLATAAQEVEDSTRAVRITADALRAGLDVRASADSSSDEGRPLSHRGDDVQWTLGLDVNLPFGRLPERNAYRSALVRLQAAERSFERFRDRVAADVRDALRQARNARASYQIQVRAVELADRRVRSANLNLEAGRASTRDLLESQAALLEAQNAQTAALVDFNLALFDLYLQLEVLRVDGEGIQVDEERVAALLAVE